MAQIPKNYIRELVPDRSRILEAILFLIERGNELSQYDIVKAIFLADRSHLNKYGRPITFDNYVAMEHGPVPTFTYDTLKPDFDFKKYYNEERPWVFLGDGNVNRFVEVKRGFDSSVLSKTDVEALDTALKIVSSLDFHQIKRLTHEDPAYVEAWDRRGRAASSDMQMKLLVNEGDGEEVIEDLAYISRQA